MRMIRKRLGDVRPGDVLLDENGRTTRVTGVTPEKTPDALYEVLLESNTGRRVRIRADEGHAWPIDPADAVGIPVDAQGETEASTLDVAAWTARGLHPALAPSTTVDGVIHRWRVRSCVLLPPEESERTRVACVRVDSPSHTFLVDDASTPVDDEIASSEPGNGDVTLTGPSGEMVAVDRASYDRAMRGVPTHNCGGPLTLDTAIRRDDGGIVRMGDVRVGDRLRTVGGSSTIVTGVSPIMDPVALTEVVLEPVAGTGLPDPAVLLRR